MLLRSSALLAPAASAENTTLRVALVKQRRSPCDAMQLDVARSVFERAAAAGEVQRAKAHLEAAMMAEWDAKAWAELLAEIDRLPVARQAADPALR